MTILQNRFYDESAPNDYLTRILTAQVYDVAIESPLQPAVAFSKRMENSILLKREDLQPVFSFKLRGAYNKIRSLSPEERKRGVIACSAGNHAQGVALAAKKLGIRATIVMPLATPAIKWQNVKRLGAEIILHGNDFDEAKVECDRLSAERQMTIIPPFDDPDVIAGQGTIALELLRQHNPSDIHAIFVCVGGGGLAAGVSSYIKSVYPKIKVYGVETYDAAGMTTSLEKGEITHLDQVGLFADGAAVRCIGKETFKICKHFLDGMIMVDTDEICAAIRDTFEDTRSIVEPAGALAVAGLKKYIDQTGVKEKTMIAVLSGANIDFSRLSFISERASFGDNSRVLISVVIPETPGSFMKLYKAIHPRSVFEFSYRYSGSESAHIFMCFGIKDVSRRKDEIESIFMALSRQKMQATDLTHDEVAKTHARYMISGKKSVENERLFRFSFPEKPGALFHFLTTLSFANESKPWNVTLFHYRNYGGDVGKVMVGIQVPPETSERFEVFLRTLKYPYVEETNSSVCMTFLK